MNNRFIEYRLKNEGYSSIDSIPGTASEKDAFISEAFDQYAAFQKALYKSDGDLNDLMNALSRTYLVPSSIVSSSFEAIAASDNIMKYEALFDPEKFEQMTNVMIWDKSFYESQTTSGANRYDSQWLEDFDVPMIYYNIIVDGSFYARLILIVEEEWRIPYIEAIADEVGKVLTYRFNDAMQKRGGGLRSKEFMGAMDQILSGSHPGDIIALNNAGWQKNHNYRAYCFRFDNRYPMETGRDYLLKRLSSVLGECYIAERNSLIVCICNISRSPALKNSHKTLISFLTEYIGKVGISNEFTDLFMAPSFVKQAEWAITLGSNKDPMFWYYYFSTYSYDYIFEKSTSEFPASELIMPELITLKKRDEEKDSELLKTLETYVKNKCNGQSTARDLFIHRTTFLYRIQIIQKLTGLNIEDPDTFKKLVIAFELLDRSSRT